MLSDNAYMADHLSSVYLDLMAEAVGLVPDGQDNEYHPGKHCWHDDMRLAALKCCRCDAALTKETVKSMTRDFRLTYRAANGPTALSGTRTGLL